ncbi:hypothetical protein ACP70R_037422 [Stipagrostis hirtigluma subsp. patula]
MEGKNEAVLVVCGEECDEAPLFDINTGEKILYIPDCSAPPSSLACAVGHLLAASRSEKNQPTSGGANKDQPTSSGASKDHPTSGGAIYFWNPNKLQQTHKSYIQEAVGPITCSKDGMYLIGGAYSGNAYIWELTRGALLKRWRAHKNAISFLSFSQDSSVVISGSKDGTVHVWCMLSLFQAEESKPQEATKLCPIFRDAIKHEASITGILTIRGSPRPTLIASSLDGCCKTEVVHNQERAFTAIKVNGTEAITTQRWVTKEATFAVFLMFSDCTCVRSLHVRPETIAAAARCMKHSVDLLTEPLLMLGIDTARNPVNVALVTSSDAGLYSSLRLMLPTTLIATPYSSTLSLLLPVAMSVAWVLPSLGMVIDVSAGVVLLSLLLLLLLFSPMATWKACIMRIRNGVVSRIKALSFMKDNIMNNMTKQTAKVVMISKIPVRLLIKL